MSTEDQTVTAERPAATESAALTSEERSHATSDWGEVNREQLAFRLREAYHENRGQQWFYEDYVKPRPLDPEWLDVANAAIDALLETPQ